MGLTISLPSFATALYVINFIVIIKIIYEGRDSRSTFAWVSIILLLPVVGLIAFLFFGRRGLSKSRKILNQERLLNSHLEDMMEDHHSDQKRERALFDRRGFGKRYSKVLNLALKNPEALLSSSNKIKIFHSGQEKFDDLYEDIEEAKDFVHLAYYIWRDDILTRRFVDLLERKVREGVEVRIFLDYIGSLLLSRFYLSKLRRKGIRIKFFSAMYSSAQFHTLNYRNHTKIAVIDGKIAYTGGMNMGKEYIDGGRSFEFWRDTHLRVEGEATSIYNGIFMVFWHRFSKEKLPEKKYFPRMKQIKGSILQVVGSGIDVNWSSMENIFLSLIINARKSVYIQTPYFIPSDSLLSALKIAALSGVKVNLMVAGKPDKFIPHWTSFNFFEDLLRAGVRIYRYNKGFLHSKTMVIDNEVSIVGSINIDVRSFKLNYEVGTILYDFKLSRELTKQFRKDLEYCSGFSLENLKRINILAKFRNSFFKLFASLL